jgi:hypothetical protein
MSVVALLLALFFPPCLTEDSTWCYWDASTQGNGQGVSFVTLSEGDTIYLGRNW